MDSPADLILATAEDLGFALAGVAAARPSDHAQAARQWIDEGMHGQMHYLEEHLEVRMDPQRLLAGARSVIAVADAYPAQVPVSDEGADAPSNAQPRGRIARYAWGDDYHKTIKQRLHRLSDTLSARFPQAAFRSTVDTAPAFEREHATRAGLGWSGKNTMLIHPRHGSYTLLGLILTTLELPTSEAAGYPGRGAAPTDHCANCTRCIDACPTDAIDPAGHRIDARRCISYLTIEHREPIDPALHGPMGDWLAGCDICQEVCPYNEVGRRFPLPIHQRYRPRPLAEGLSLLEVLHWDADDRAEIFRGSALKRIKLDMLRRNALIAAGNYLASSADPSLLEAVRDCASDPSDLVRQTAAQVLQRLEDDATASTSTDV